jgi:hypothetical protein
MTDIKYKCINKKIAAIILVVGLFIGGGIVFSINNRNIEKVDSGQVLSAEVAGEKVLNIINEHILAPQGITASLVSEVVAERGLYRMTLDIEGQEEVIYITKDGALLFPQMAAVDLVALVATPAPDQVQEEPTECEKFQAELTPERKVKIAKCLAERDYRVYIADWCPFCRDQKELFGEAAKYLTSTDCYDPEGGPGNLGNCPDLPGVPAWRDRDGNQLKYNGEIVDGMIQIRRLVEISGCYF